ncbi:MAG TPA: hypothetical protein VMV94_14050, partial [Phycisphaerae bacterium]|nr:hypothetical protein [Phycisphaerae bacterium]
MKAKSIYGTLTFLACLSSPAGMASAAGDDLPALLADELKYSMEHLATPDGTKPYYMSYAVTDVQSTRMSATLGTLLGDETNHSRLLDVEVRVGDYSLDSTHKIRGGDFDIADMAAGGPTQISLNDDPDAIRHALWLATDSRFKAAARRYERVQTNLKTKVEEEDKSGDFTHEKPSVFSKPPATLKLDRAAWAERIRKVSRIARDYPLIYNSDVALSAEVENHYLVTSEGTRIQQGQVYLRVVVSASTKATDGMELSQSFIFNAGHEDKLPSEQQVTDALVKVIKQVMALREAPLVEPYVGPA